MRNTMRFFVILFFCYIVASTHIEMPCSDSEQCRGAVGGGELAWRYSIPLGGEDNGDTDVTGSLALTYTLDATEYSSAYSFLLPTAQSSVAYTAAIVVVAKVTPQGTPLITFHSLNQSGSSVIDPPCLSDFIVINGTKFIVEFSVDIAVFMKDYPTHCVTTAFPVLFFAGNATKDSLLDDSFDLVLKGKKETPKHYFPEVIFAHSAAILEAPRAEPITLPSTCRAHMKAVKEHFSATPRPSGTALTNSILYGSEPDKLHGAHNVVRQLTFAVEGVFVEPTVVFDSLTGANVLSPSLLEAINPNVIAQAVLADEVADSVRDVNLIDGIIATAPPPMLLNDHYVALPVVVVSGEDEEEEEKEEGCILADGVPSSLLSYVHCESLRYARKAARHNAVVYNVQGADTLIGVVTVRTAFNSKVLPEGLHAVAVKQRKEAIQRYLGTTMGTLLNGTAEEIMKTVRTHLPNITAYSFFDGPFRAQVHFNRYENAVKLHISLKTDNTGHNAGTTGDPFAIDLQEQTSVVGGRVVGANGETYLRQGTGVFRALSPLAKQIHGVRLHGVVYPRELGLSFSSSETAARVAGEVLVLTCFVLTSIYATRRSASMSPYTLPALLPIALMGNAYNAPDGEVQHPILFASDGTSFRENLPHAVHLTQLGIGGTPFRDYVGALCVCSGVTLIAIVCILILVCKHRKAVERSTVLERLEEKLRVQNEVSRNYEASDRGTSVCEGTVRIVDEEDIKRSRVSLMKTRTKVLKVLRRAGFDVFIATMVYLSGALLFLAIAVTFRPRDGQKYSDQNGYTSLSVSGTTPQTRSQMKDGLLPFEVLSYFAFIIPAVVLIAMLHIAFCGSQYVRKIDKKYYFAVLARGGVVTRHGILNFFIGKEQWTHRSTWYGDEDIRDMRDMNLTSPRSTVGGSALQHQSTQASLAPSAAWQTQQNHNQDTTTNFFNEAWLALFLPFLAPFKSNALSSVATHHLYLLITMTLLALTPPSANSCKNRSIILTAVSSASLTRILLFRPYEKTYEMVTEVLLLSMQIVVFAGSISGGIQEISRVLIVVAPYVLLVKVLVDVVVLRYIVSLVRRGAIKSKRREERRDVNYEAAAQSAIYSTTGDVVSTEGSETASPASPPPLSDLDCESPSHARARLQRKLQGTWEVGDSPAKYVTVKGSSASNMGKISIQGTSLVLNGLKLISVSCNLSGQVIAVWEDGEIWVRDEGEEVVVAAGQLPPARTQLPKEETSPVCVGLAVPETHLEVQVPQLAASLDSEFEVV